MRKRALITGITGQDGAYLAEFLLKMNYEVYGFVSRRVNQSYSNLDYFNITSKINFIFGDITDLSSINYAIKTSRPHEVYNLAAMSFVGLSWQEPLHTANVNGHGVLLLLDAVKNYSPDAKFYQASTSEMFGNNWEEDETQNELTAFRPRSPYATSKVFAHHNVVMYRESYGIQGSCGILFNHESPIRGLEFVTRKITDAVARIHLGLQESIELGNLEARRDWGFAGDYVKVMWKMLQQDTADDYVIATGQTRSIIAFLDRAFAHVGINSWEKYVVQNPEFMRPAEVPHLRGNPAKAKEKLNWENETSFEKLIEIMMNADLKRYTR